MIKIEKEIYKDITGYEGLYQVSNYGNIKSLPKSWHVNHNLIIRNERILKPHPDKDGYYTVKLCKDGKIKTCKIHRLVAIEFIKNPLNLPIINHKDENKKNNLVDNLEWCTYKYNNLYGNRLKKVKNTVILKDSFKNNKKTVLQFDLNNNFIKEYNSITEASENSYCLISNISSCCRGKAKTSGGFMWKFKGDD